jgi:sodium transport system ATP-binding protein
LEFILEAILKVINLTRYFKEFCAIENVSFDAYPGEIFGLLGPNGAGKTTTIRAISTIIQPTSGTVEVKGFSTHTQPQLVRRNIGVLSTEVGVYERFTGRENLRYFGQLYDLEPTQLEQRINELSNLLKMQEFIDRPAGKYSTGMKQKLAIARSIVHDPDVIFFDEPTSGLDVLAAQTILKFMHHAKDQGKCIVFSTHHLHEAEKLCERVGIIHNGHLIACDSINNIVTNSNTNNLEEAFLKIVQASGETRVKEAPETPKAQMARIISVIGALMVVLGFLFTFIPSLKAPEIVSYCFIGVGAILLFAGRFISKQKGRK